MAQNYGDPHPKAGFSGQFAPPSGTVTELPDVSATRVLIRPLSGNSADVYLGRVTGTFDASNGWPLAATDDPIELEGLDNLNRLVLLNNAVGDGIAFLVLYDPQSNPLT